MVVHLSIMISKAPAMKTVRWRPMWPCAASRASTVTREANWRMGGNRMGPVFDVFRNIEILRRLPIRKDDDVAFTAVYVLRSTSPVGPREIIGVTIRRIVGIVTIGISWWNLCKVSSGLVK
ncbi:MAG: hypothetical protein C4293_04025 [Nitrospiraceae bacterium]